ncbi:hypothetical protein LXL04_015398 [Taraxacum kok-saghyz]
MSIEKFIQSAIPKFDGHYDYRAMIMENLLMSEQVWSLVEEGIPASPIGVSVANEAQKKLVDEAKTKDMKVKNFLFQVIGREILETILDKGTSKAIWDSMKQKYQGSTKVKRAQLQAFRREFELLTMKEGEHVDSFLGRTLAIVNKMKSNGEKMDQSTVVNKVLRSLTTKFNYVVCSIEESNDLGTLSIHKLHGSLLVHEQRMQGYLEEEQVLKVAQEDRSGRGRGRECYNCHKLGHYQFECPKLERKATYVEEEELVLLMACEDEEPEPWFFDSGCSIHMTGNKQWFSTFDEKSSQTVRIGNNMRIPVVSKGSVKVKVEVYHPTKGIIMRATMRKNRMFSLSLNPTTEDPMCIQAEGVAEKEAQLWHRRFVHLNYKSLRTLFYQKMVDGLPSIKSPGKLCSTCLIRKQQRQSFPKKSLWRATKQLELVHSDLYGPISPTLNSNK